ASMTRFRHLLESKHYATGTRWLNRWGAPAVTLSFLTIGVQTMVNLAAGATRMPLRRYIPAVTVGCIIWAFIYSTVGFIGFAAIAKLWELTPIGTLAVGALAVAGIAFTVLRRDKAEPAPAE
ncbi:MAG TPA: VTT domain-containing protein, partial [Tessaracoccus flavescens]|nr:VTT domain-containing protein [Tessaracoccus flavescens]